MTTKQEVKTSVRGTGAPVIKMVDMSPGQFAVIVGDTKFAGNIVLCQFIGKCYIYQDLSDRMYWSSHNSHNYPEFKDLKVRILSSVEIIGTI